MPSNSPWRPRMAAELSIPLLGAKSDRIAQNATDSTISVPVRVRRARWVRNDHNHADEIELSLEWKDAGIDPRLVSSAAIRFWLGNADDTNNWTPTDADLRFAGVMTSIERTASEEGGSFEVKVSGQDYTQLFLESRPFHTDGAPDYDMPLSEAWAKVCDWTGPLDADGTVISTVSALRDRLVFQGGAKDVVLGRAINSRLANGTIPVKPNTDAWAVWQQAVGMLGLISYIDRDTCIVTTATDYYSAKNPPVLVWGRNLLRLSERRNVKFSGKGVGVQSYDALLGTTIEALYPPPGDDRIKAKQSTAKQSTKAHKAPSAEPRDFFAVPNVTNPSVLADIAQRIYEERTRQDLEGQATTREMSVETADGGVRDLLTLGAGEVIRIEFDAAHLQQIARLSDLGARVDYLAAIGYSPEIATLLAKNLAEIARLDATFFTRTVEVEFEPSNEGGNFDVKIQFVNRIQIDGSAK